MRIHIVCRNYTNDRILSRLAVSLVNNFNYSISDKPDETADLNYAFPYLELLKYDKKFIALFTHKEDNVPDKARLWEKQAHKAELRLTFAKMYLEDLEKYGKAYIVTPPLDRNKFRPILNRLKTGKPTIGISGFVYYGGRKGEQLITQILKTPIAQKFNWIASGRGWPVETKTYPWLIMEEFYQSLDIYLCSAVIEGVPYPPLEAMACGVKCIIPRGLGILDELPELPDLVRYKRGNIKHLEKALEIAYENIDKVDKLALRDATEKYSFENWFSDHQKVFEDYIESNVRKSKLYTMAASSKLSKSDIGIYTVAYGDPARNCARKLIHSIKMHMPEIPVAVCSNVTLEMEDYFIEFPDADIGGRTAKIKVYDLIPEHWQYALYLDSDILLSANISFIFDALKDGWEMVISKDVDQYSTAYDLFRRDSSEGRLGVPIVKTDQILALAGGMIAFRRCENVKTFFEQWYKEWFILARRDQGALLRAYYKNPPKLLVVGNEWNSISKFFDIRNTAGIEHYNGGPARRWKGAYPGRLDNFKDNLAYLGSGIRIDLKDFKETFELIALKSFVSGNKMIKRMETFYALGEFSLKLVEMKLACCIKKIGVEDFNKNLYINIGG